MSEPTSIKINEVEYVRKDSQPVTTGDIRIVILQRGWIVVGYFNQTGSDCSVEKAAVIRKWGTKKGLGEIAVNGPTPSTILDPCPTVRFNEMTIVATIDCVREKWETKLS